MVRLRVKLFESYSFEDLEVKINRFLAITNTEIVSIHYQVVFRENDGDIYYTSMIEYDGGV